MNLNQITECGVCGEKCHTIAGPKENPIRIEFDCGSIVEVSSNEYGYQWVKRCRFADAKNNTTFNVKSSSDIKASPCLRCGSPIKSMLKDGDNKVVSVDYCCGSKSRIASNGMWEFDALCRKTEKQPRPKPVLHIGSHELSSVPKELVEKLEADGYAVVLTQFAGGVRILSPEPALASAEEIGMSALEAMQGPTNDSVRAKFAEILFRKLQERDGGAK